MKITIDIPSPPSEQRIIDVPIHFCGGQVVDAGGYGFEERKTGKRIVIFAYSGKQTVCSECGTRLSDIKANFCYNCGARF